MQSRRSFVGTIFPILSLVFALCSLGHAAVPNRIASVVPEARRPVQNTVSPRAKSSIDLGAAPGSLKLNGLMLQFNKTAAQRAALDQLMADQQNPSSPRYHQWLTPQQFGAQFGLSADDIAHVTSWLTAQGFTVTGVAKSSTFVTFSGTAAQVQRAFGTTIHSLSLNGESHIANVTDPVLPSAIASVVANISGLNDFRPEAHLRVHQVPANAIRPHFTAPGNTTFHAIAPADFNIIYNVNPLIASNGLSGAGIGGCSNPSVPCGDIAVLGQVDITSYTNDLKAFRTAAGLPAALPDILSFGANPGAPSSACINNPNTTPNCHPALSDLQESLFDIEWAGAIAPSAKILFVTST
ncbi:MAG TPA: protease pro-enzyme activation domain-containing protein, partial [Edaphobacter sp.]|uniref:S53 family peptidase n=1 Tax=Edaphobacter sp. TaxID=1934404 RepID=UPI002C6D451A